MTKGRSNAGSARKDAADILKDQKVVHIIINGIIRTLREHTQTECVAKTPSYAKNQNREAIKIAGVLTLTNRDSSTSLLLGFSQDTFLNIYKNMFNQSAPNISNENQDLAGELLNISFGIMDPEMRSIGYEMIPSFPVVLQGEDLQNKLANTDESSLIVPFETKGKTFFLEIFTGPSSEEK